MTYGQIRFSLSQMFPGLSLDLLDGWIAAVYTEILDKIPWKRAEGQSIFQCPPSYAVGTITATQGSNVITGAGTAWTQQMSGLMIRVACQTEYYGFTYVSATSGTLDRPYEQLGAAALSYRIDQNIFSLPTACRIVRQVVPLHDRTKPLRMATPGELNRIAASRNDYGTPIWAAPTWDSNTNPPVMQLELLPIPSVPDSTGAILSFAVDYIYDQADLDADQTGFSMLPWVRPGAIIEGVSARVKRWKDNPAGAMGHETKFKELVQDMKQVNALQRGPQTIRLAPHLRRQVPGYYRNGPKHRGYTG